MGRFFSRFINRILPWLTMIVLITFTAFMYGAHASYSMQINPRIYQETRDAIQDQQIDRVTTQAEATARRLDILTNEMYSVKAALEKLNGIGMGFGSLLSILVALDVFYRVRTAKQSTREG